MIEIISGREFPAKVIPLIEQAKQSIDIVVFDWRWYPQDPGSSCQLFNQAIIQAKKRSLKIRAIANNDQIVNILRQAGCQATKLQTKKLVHCKLMIIDQSIAITGSHNYTQSAFQMNLELSVIIPDLEDGNKFQLFFNNIWTLK